MAHRSEFSVSNAQPTSFFAVDANHTPASFAVGQALLHWTSNPVPLPRPVVLHPGFLMPACMLDGFYDTLRLCTTASAERIVRVQCHPMVDLKDLGALLAHRAESLYEEGDGFVDVIAHSMGGIVTREAARAVAHRPRLRVRRVFCLATPHQGAGFLASLAPHPQAQALCEGSTYLAELNGDGSSSDFEMHTFRLRGDVLVSAESAHAVGTTHHDWEPANPWLPPHAQAQWDIRIRAAVVGLLLGHLQAA